MNKQKQKVLRKICLGIGLLSGIILMGVSLIISGIVIGTAPGSVWDRDMLTLIGLVFMPGSVWLFMEMDTRLRAEE